MTLTLISIGLRDHHDLSLRALEEARACDKLYAETYTMKLDTTPEALSRLIGKTVIPSNRKWLEEAADALLDEAEKKNVGVLVGGDALSATTHISLLVDARRRGIEARVIHGSSVLTAVAETGLSLYKFGRTVTVPLPEKGPVDTVLRTLKDNRENGLHTLILLDLDIPEDRHLTINEALQRLLEAGLDPGTLTVAAARLGYGDSVIKAHSAGELAGHDFGEPPHTLVVPGSLHFLEAEALKVLAGCPPELLEGRRVRGELDQLIEKYLHGCRGVLGRMELNPLPASITVDQVSELTDHAERYLRDAEYYAIDKKPTALASVSYAEGILDALKLLGIAEFEW